MLIGYVTSDLKRICLEQKTAQAELGTDCAKKLRTRLADLQAAANVTELLSGRPHPLKGDRKGQFAVDLARGRRLVFIPTEDPPPKRKDNTTDWSLVTAVTVVFIGDYHD
jgi:proteic killer suppression protein